MMLSMIVTFLKHDENGRRIYHRGRLKIHLNRISSTYHNTETTRVEEYLNTLEQLSSNRKYNAWIHADILVKRKVHEMNTIVRQYYIL